MAGEPSNPRCDGHQDSPLCSAFASIHRAIDRHNSPRVFGPVAVLDGSRLGREVNCVQRLLQRIPLALGTEWEDSGRGRSRKKYRFQLLWMETALSRSISNANG